MVCPFEGRGSFLKFLLNFPFEINLHNKKETKESNILFLSKNNITKNNWLKCGMLLRDDQSGLTY